MGGVGGRLRGVTEIFEALVECGWARPGLGFLRRVCGEGAQDTNLPTRRGEESRSSDLVPGFRLVPVREETGARRSGGTEVFYFVAQVRLRVTLRSGTTLIATLMEGPQKGHKTCMCVSTG